MISKHREAFQLKQNKTPLEENINKIVQEAQLKMKNFISQKDSLSSSTNLLIGKNEVLSNEINELNLKNEDLNNEIKKLNEQLSDKNNEIKKIDTEYKGLMKQAFDKEKEYKNEINSIDTDLNMVKVGTIREESQHKEKIKKKSEELLYEKHENALLREKLYNLNRELYLCEIAENESNVIDQQNKLKAEKGIENINQMFELNHKIKK